MTEYMTMAEAYKIADDNDTLQCINPGGLDKACYVCTKKGMRMSQPCFDFAISDKWEVVKAEPRVLTNEEIYEKIRSKRFGFDMDLFSDQFLDMIESINQNGQLKEWNRLEKLRKAAQMAFIFLKEKNLKYGDYGYGPLYGLEQALKNLKQPCQ